MLPSCRFIALQVCCALLVATVAPSAESETPPAIRRLPAAPSAPDRSAQSGPLRLQPQTAVAGDKVQAEVKLAAPAPRNGVAVPMRASNPDAVIMPATLIVRPGETVGAITITLRPEAPARPLAISATIPDSGLQTATLAVSASPVALGSVSVPASVALGQSAAGTIVLTSPARASGIDVLLSSSNGDLVQVPKSVTVPAGQTTSSFPLTVSSTGAPGTAIVKASFNGLSRDAQVAVRPLLPTAKLTALPARAACGQPVTLDGSASSHTSPRSIVKYEWDFDVPEAAVAGRTTEQIAAAFTAEGQGKVVARPYPRFGTYHPVLRVTDDQGRSALAWGDAVVVDQGNHAPRAHAGGPYATYVYATPGLSLDASSSDDPDQACGDKLAKYEWDVGGLGTFVTAAGPTALFTWQDLDTRLRSTRLYPADPTTREPTIPVVLRTTDAFGVSSTATGVLRIYDRSPIPKAAWGPKPAVPLVSQDGFKNATGAVALDGSASYHGYPDVRITDWNWRVKGATASVSGQIATLNVALPNLPVPLPTGGVTRTITLTVTDEYGKKNALDFDVTFGVAR